MASALKARKKQKDAYHHGDLRHALLVAARREVERDGIASVSLKALATSLGVSQPAPYRHFADREALLMAVAAEGFRELGAALRATDMDLDALCDAYIGFARAHVGLYRLMFVSQLVPSAEPSSELAESSDDCYALLMASTARLTRAPGARDVARVLWAALHGLALLSAEGFLGPPGASPELVRAASTAARAACAELAR